MKRRSFIKCLSLFAAAPALPALSAVVSDEKRGGRVEWARLKTDYVYWNRHSEAEPVIVDFIREQTSFDISPQWRAADIQDLKQLTAFPFLFSEGIHTLSRSSALENLREYLERGGFLFIDACINNTVNPDADVFLAGQVAKLREILPEAQVAPVPADDPIYSCYFKMEHGLPHSYMRSIYDPRWARHGLYRVSHRQRAVAMISLSGLKCGWARLQTMPHHDVECMRMMVNIYLYALTH